MCLGVVDRFNEEVGRGERLGMGMEAGNVIRERRTHATHQTAPSCLVIFDLAQWKGVQWWRKGECTLVAFRSIGAIRLLLRRSLSFCLRSRWRGGDRSNQGRHHAGEGVSLVA